MTAPDENELKRIAERFEGMDDRALGRRFIAAENELAAYRSRRPATKGEAHARVDELATDAAAALKTKLGELRFHCGKAAGLDLGMVAGLADMLAASDPAVMQRLHDAIDAPATFGQADPFAVSLDEWASRKSLLEEELRDLAIERDRRALGVARAEVETRRQAFEQKHGSREHVDVQEVVVT